MKLLTTEVRDFIVSLYSDGNVTQTSIATMVGTTQGNVSKVLSRARQYGQATLARDLRRRPFRSYTRIHSVSQMGSRRSPINLDDL